MTINEQALVFDCAGDTLIGVVASPESPPDVGVLIIVGGPQYRAGSHRQFTLLARFLAGQGVACMRFDYRGMGDSSGSARDFEAVGDDVSAAIDAFVAHVPQVRKVVLWGLCDGASAASFRAPMDDRIAGLVLLNPWVRTEAGKAKAMLKHYYLGRLFDRRFWKKFFTGGVGVLGSISSLWANVVKSGSVSLKPVSVSGTKPVGTLPDRLLAALARRDLPIAVFLSGRDYVAKEFDDVVAGSVEWQRLMQGRRMAVVRFEAADHTFSSAARRDAVALATWKWLLDQRLIRDGE